jgi:Iron-containing redox enzyme
MYQKLPTLVDGLQFQRNAQEIQIRVGTDNFSIEFDNEHLAAGAETVMRELSRGASDVSALARAFDASLQPYDTRTFLGILESHALLTDAEVPKDVIGGRRFICDVQAHIRNDVLPRHPLDKFAAQVQQKSVSAQTMRRWTVEYYFVTRFAERCIVGVLNQPSTPAMAKTLWEFLQDELGHDKLLERSLRGFGLGDSDFAALVPHLSTDATMGMLLRTSHFDLPTFVALVGQMEGTAARSLEYMEALEACDVPAEAKLHQRRHEEINVEHGHGDVARSLADELHALSLADLQRAKDGLGLYIGIRRSATPYIVGDCDAYGTWSRADVEACLAKFWPRILQATLPIAAARSDEVASKALIRRLVVLKGASVHSWNEEDRLELLAAMVENSLWKTAYQSVQTYVETIEWIDGLVAGARQPPVNGPASVSQPLLALFWSDRTFRSN